MNLIRQLNEPFPDRSSHGQSLIGVGIFVGLFLYIVKPFGIEGVGDQLLIISMGFGGITVLFGWIHDVVSRYVFKIRTDLPSWTLWKWIIQATVLIIWIAFGNFIYMNSLSNGNWFDWEMLLQMIWYTFIVGIFPIVFSGFTLQLKAASLYKEEAVRVKGNSSFQKSNNSNSIVIQPAASQPHFELIFDELRYVEAMQNYVIIYTHKNGVNHKEVVRATISSMVKSTENSSIIRCHRSYLVNSNCIEDVNGNAQGLKLKVKDVNDKEIPVSRTYISSLKQGL